MYKIFLIVFLFNTFTSYLSACERRKNFSESNIYALVTTEEIMEHVPNLFGSASEFKKKRLKKNNKKTKIKNISKYESKLVNRSTEIIDENMVLPFDSDFLATDGNGTIDIDLKKLENSLFGKYIFNSFFNYKKISKLIKEIDNSNQAICNIHNGEEHIFVGYVNKENIENIKQIIFSNLTKIYRFQIEKFFIDRADWLYNLKFTLLGASFNVFVLVEGMISLITLSKLYPNKFPTSFLYQLKSELLGYALFFKTMFIAYAGIFKIVNLELPSSSVPNDHFMNEISVKVNNEINKLKNIILGRAVSLINVISS